MSSKSKKPRKKAKLTKSEIDAMVKEVLEEAELETKAETEGPAPEAAEAAEVITETSPETSEASPEAVEDAEEAILISQEAAEAAEEVAGTEQETISETPEVLTAEAEKAEAEPEEAEAELQESEAEPEAPAAEAGSPEARPETRGSAQEAPEAETEETSADTLPEDATEAEAPDEVGVLPKVDEKSPEPTGSKTVLLTVKEDGKLAIAANRDGEIIFEDNVIPPKPTFFQKYKKFIITAAAILCVALMAFVYDHLIPKNITVVINSMSGTQEITAKVPAYDVQDVLEKMEIPVSDIDQVLPFFTEQVDSGSVITINKRLEALATVEGKPKKVILIPGTVRENLEFNEIEYDADDIISPALNEKMTLTSKIVVKDFVKVVTEKEKTIKSGARIILDPNLSSGVRVDSDAKDGTALYKYTTTYIDGVDQGTVEEFSKWISEPQDDLVRLGTSVTGHSGNVNIVWSFVSNTTAYYMGENAYGASGGHCHYGTCAVDPSVIPYGSILWVSGYGFAVANDCGGAIVGTNLDLYMRSVPECNQWGRRYVTAYLLSWA